MPTRRRFFAQLSAIGAASGLSALDHLFALAPTQGHPTIITTWENIGPIEAAWKILSAPNGYALDAVEAGAKYSEADPDNQYVGRGGHPDREGRVTVDASIMDETGRGGCVAFLEDILHPISVARKVMEKTPHVLLVGEGARQFALAEGFEKTELMTEKTWDEYQKWLITAEYKPVINAERHDTIGLLGLDRASRLAGACSTSGMPYKMRGRVGDSPILGAGLYVDGAVGAATSSGLGELVLKTLGAFMVVEEMRRGAHPRKACERAVRRIAGKLGEEAKNNQVGFVALDKTGRTGAFALQKGFNFTVMSPSGMVVQDAGYLF